MDKSRNYIIDRIMSRTTTIDEFNFDKLEAPPLSFFLSPFDIQELHSIATSIRYNANLQLKYDAIDKIMSSRGMTRFAAGTNRVVYRHPEFPDILFKVAVDNVGMKDNPAEFRNQFYLKPFVCKIFEISPCGTVAIVEKCNPITNREEFLSVADDIFEMITEWLVGKYVMADIGAKYFLNYSIREGFGPVLIDYPYMYELDGNKLYCNKMDKTSPTGTCDGEIDYDNGFNFLVCTKCGAVYKAKELEKKIKDNELIVSRKGDISMKIKISGGTNAVNTTVTTEDTVNSDLFAPTKTSIGTGLSKLIENATSTPKKVVFGATDNKKEDTPSIKVTKKVEPVKEEEKKEEVVEEPVKETKVYTKPEIAEVHVADVPEVDKSVNGVKAKTVVSAIKISDDIKEAAIKAEESKADKPKTPVENIDNAIEVIKENLKAIDVDAIRFDAAKRLIKAITEAGNITDDGVLYMLGIDNPSVHEVSYDIDAMVDTMKDAFSDVEIYSRLASALINLLNESEDEDYYQMTKNKDIIDIVSRLFVPTIDITSYDINGTNIELEYDANLALDFNDEDKEIVSTTKDCQIVVEIDELAQLTDETTQPDVDDDEEEVTSKASTEHDSYAGLLYFDGEIMNAKELFPAEDINDTVLVVKTDNGDYLTVNDKIVAVDVVDNHSLASQTLVSTDWFTKMEAMANSDDIEESESGVIGVLTDEEAAPIMSEEEMLAAEKASEEASEEE